MSKTTVSLADLIQEKAWELICCMQYPFTKEEVDEIMMKYMLFKGIFKNGTGSITSEALPYDEEFGDIAGIFANTGDGFATTLTFDVKRRRFVFQSEIDLAAEIADQERLCSPDHQEWRIQKLQDKINDMKSNWDDLIDQIRKKEWEIKTDPSHDVESIRLWMEDFVRYNEYLYD